LVDARLDMIDARSDPVGARLNAVVARSDLVGARLNMIGARLSILIARMVVVNPWLDPVEMRVGSINVYYLMCSCKRLATVPTHEVIRT